MRGHIETEGFIQQLVWRLKFVLAWYGISIGNIWPLNTRSFKVSVVWCGGSFSKQYPHVCVLLCASPTFINVSRAAPRFLFYFHSSTFPELTNTSSEEQGSYIIHQDCWYRWYRNEGACRVIKKKYPFLKMVASLENFKKPLRCFGVFDQQYYIIISINNLI